MTDAWDELLKKSLKRESRPAAPPLSDEDVRLFVANRLEGERLQRVLDRLEQSADDRAWVESARAALDAIGEAAGESVDEALLRRALRPGPQGACPHCGGAITPFKKPPVRQKISIVLWTALCLAGFGLSFVFPRYFVQCVALGLLAGFKAIADQRALKTQVLIYRALEEPAPPVRRAAGAQRPV